MRTHLPIPVIAVLGLALAGCGTWDPTADEAPEATRSEIIEGGDTAGNAELTVGDASFSFSVTDCFANEDGMEFSGQTDTGERITGEYDPEVPEEGAITITNSDGETVYSSSSEQAPTFEVSEDGGFQVNGTFVSDADEELQGTLSGAC